MCCAEFIKKFKPHVSSTMNDPHFPSDFLPKSAKEEGEASTAVPEKLTLNFFLPHETTLKDSKVRCSYTQCIRGLLGDQTPPRMSQLSIIGAGLLHAKACNPRMTLWDAAVLLSTSASASGRSRRMQRRFTQEDAAQWDSPEFNSAQGWIPYQFCLLARLQRDGQFTADLYKGCHKDICNLPARCDRVGQQQGTSGRRHWEAAECRWTWCCCRRSQETLG